MARRGIERPPLATSPGDAPPVAPAGALVWSALWTVYIVWGSTYLAIRVMVETLPPLLASGARFALAGVLLGGVLVARGGWSRLRMTRRQLGVAALVGVLLILGGNGLVAVAEQDVPSGLAALVIAAVPLWVVLLRVSVRERPAPATVLGVLLGLPGLAVLLLPGGLPSGVPTAGVALITVASLSWAIGSFTGPRLGLPPDPLAAATVEMLVGGLVQIAVGRLTGERLDLAAVSGVSALSWAYLVVFGSLLAFTAYGWLLQNAPISKVATYAYVNPVVAVVLGGVILDEQLTVTMAVGGLVVVGAVAVVVTAESRRVRR